MLIFHFNIIIQDYVQQYIINNTCILSLHPFAIISLKQLCCDSNENRKHVLLKINFTNVTKFSRKSQINQVSKLLLGVSFKLYCHIYEEKRIPFDLSKSIQLAFNFSLCNVFLNNIVNDRLLYWKANGVYTNALKHFNIINSIGNPTCIPFKGV